MPVVPRAAHVDRSSDRRPLQPCVACGGELLLSVLRRGRLVLACTFALACGNPSDDVKLSTAESAISAFYGFDSAQLDALLLSADSSRIALLDYQGWAQGGNYSIAERYPCQVEPPGTVRCAVTVYDDIVRTLRLDSWVTDTFRFTFLGTRLASVATSSNDPPAVGAAFGWVRVHRPHLYDSSGVCTYRGPAGNPQECARQVMAAFQEYRAQQPQ